MGRGPSAGAGPTPARECFFADCLSRAAMGIPTFQCRSPRSRHVASLPRLRAGARSRAPSTGLGETDRRAGAQRRAAWPVGASLHGTDGPVAQIVYTEIE